MHLDVKQDTYLKSSTQQASNLPEKEKILIESELHIPAESVEKKDGHYKITAYLYEGHVKLNGKLTSAAAAEDLSEKPIRASKKGIDLIKTFEGFRNNAYQDSAGIWTIGYGHTLTARQGMTITRTQGEELLRQDLKRFEKAVRDRVTVPLTQNQFDALVSLAFNIGVGAFTGSTLLKRLNQGDYPGAANEFKRWVHAGGRRLKGLVNRREKEELLFSK